MRKTNAAPGNALGRSCLVYRGDTGPGIDLQIRVADLPLRGGSLFIGERAVRNMGAEFGMVAGESLVEALRQVDHYKALYEEAQSQLEAAQASLLLVKDLMVQAGAIQVVDEPAKATAAKR